MEKLHSALFVSQFFCNCRSINDVTGNVARAQMSLYKDPYAQVFNVL
jgi:hypothetical protein